jgi:hypothetical protein
MVYGIQLKMKDGTICNLHRFYSQMASPFTLASVGNPSFWYCHV